MKGNKLLLVGARALLARASFVVLLLLLLL